MEKRIGFIGGGNMGSSILAGILNAGLAKKDRIMVADPSKAIQTGLKEQYHVKVTEKNEEVCKNSDILFLCVKPYILSAILPQVKESLPKEAWVVSIVAGKTIEHLEAGLGKSRCIVRVMPNTPALVGEGMSAFTLNAKAGKKENEGMVKELKALLSSFGLAEEVPESLMAAVTGLSGSSPAFVFMFMEALADGAVKEGMPRDLAYQFAAQTVLGSAKLMLETGKHPGELKDMVTSPRGTTIEGVASLEQAGFRGAVMQAVSCAAEKSRNL